MRNGHLAFDWMDATRIATQPAPAQAAMLGMFAVPVLMPQRMLAGCPWVVVTLLSAWNGVVYWLVGATREHGWYL